MNKATEKEDRLYDMVEKNYSDMFRIVEICRKRTVLNISFKAKGISATTNHLIKHSGTKNGALVTRDSLAISNKGPVIKGSRRLEQAFILNGEDRSKGIQFGNYSGEYEEFIGNLTSKLNKVCRI